MATVEERIGAIEQKLDLILENQKKQAEKYENYSAFFRKKLNDSFESVLQAQTAQSVLVTDAAAGLRRIAERMEQQAQTIAPDAQLRSLSNQVTEMASDLQTAAEGLTDLVNHHGMILSRSLMDGFREVERLQDADLRIQRNQAERISEKISLSFLHLYEMLLDNNDLAAGLRIRPAGEETVPDAKE